MKIDKACFERGCACHDPRIDTESVDVVRRQWVGLTDDEVYKIYEEVERRVGEHWEGGGVILMFPTTLYQAFEDKLKEKNA